MRDTIFTDAINTKAFRITSNFWMKRFRLNKAAHGTAKFIPVSEEPQYVLKLKGGRAGWRALFMGYGSTS